jgi:hypothetical protein
VPKYSPRSAPPPPDTPNTGSHRDYSPRSAVPLSAPVRERIRYRARRARPYAVGAAGAAVATDIILRAVT